jgi:hypothetical protein
MTTPVQKLRLSPSGKFLGNPPLQLGPGSIGLVWRFHGVTSAGAACAMATTPATIVPFPGLGGTPGSDCVVAMTAGYGYDITFQYMVQTQGVTAAASWTAYYQLRDASNGAWGAWTAFPDSSGVNHKITGNTTDSTEEAWAADNHPSFSSNASYDRIRFGLYGDTANMAYYPERAFARIEQVVV